MVTHMKECQTCFRDRPADEFLLTTGENSRQEVKICRVCRGKLWDRPDDAGEIWSAMYADPET